MATDRFAAALAPMDLKPKHAGLLTVLQRGGTASQLDVARTMGVAPSLVVSLADHLQALGAVRRTRDPADRRRQVLELTDRGRELLAGCLDAARAVDDGLTASLTPGELSALAGGLAVLAAANGLPH
ncbi:MarR family transcriptional regulator [Streptomyces sp. RFCAC02]|uniref:MarR family winged helix-turn-helix transcriptional regulator n=1 Tax=Streptomyces sp. RFCAC02 TaxID=2499143 RepID=UPI001F11156A|nr:MarR family transcriptional regulator [Streptomyces sp. RFCAC02]